MIYLFHIAHSQVSQCDGVENIFNYQNFKLKSYFNLDDFKGNRMPSKSQLGQMGYTVMGAGSFGVVIVLEMEDNSSGKTFEVVTKVQKYFTRADEHQARRNNQRVNGADIEMLDAELKYLQTYGTQYASDMLQYLDCVNDNVNRIVLIITEKLDYSLQSSEFGDLSATFGPERIIQTLLKMTYSLETLHDIPKIHNDIKPENFMYVESADGSDWLIKLIDFGLVSDPGEVMDAGTPNYRDPTHWNNGNCQFKNDVYSLGLVFYFLFNGESEIGLPNDMRIFSMQNVRDDYMQKRYEAMENQMFNWGKAYGQENSGHGAFVGVIKEVVMGMSDVNYATRWGLSKVQQKLEDLLDDHYSGLDSFKESINKAKRTICAHDYLFKSLWKKQEEALPADNMYNSLAGGTGMFNSMFGGSSNQQMSPAKQGFNAPGYNIGMGFRQMDDSSEQFGFNSEFNAGGIDGRNQFQVDNQASNSSSELVEGKYDPNAAYFDDGIFFVERYGDNVNNRRIVEDARYFMDKAIEEGNYRRLII